MQTSTNRLEHNGVSLAQFVARQDGDHERPVVLVAHAWGGQNDFARDKARALAELGYVGVAIDMYGDGVLADGREESAALMKPFAEDRERLRERIAANLDAALTIEGVDADRVAAIGYCFGGMCVLELARSGAEVAAVTSFHGILDGPMPAEAGVVNASILVCHGHDDPWADPDAVRSFQDEMTAAGANWQIHIYGGVMHGFTHVGANDPENGVKYDADADRRSWKAMQDLLNEVF